MVHTSALLLFTHYYLFMKGFDPVASKTKPIRNALVWKTCLRILKPSISDDLSTETFDNE